MFKKIYNSLVNRKQHEEVKQKANAEYQIARDKAKAEWEAKNELAKMRDAAFLGTKNTAFYGTYEKYLQFGWKQPSTFNNAAYFQSQHALNQRSLMQMQSASMQNNPYANTFGLGGLAAQSARSIFG